VTGSPVLTSSASAQQFQVAHEPGDPVPGPDDADRTDREVVRLGLGKFGKVLVVDAIIRIRPPSRRNIEGFRNWIAQLPETIGVFVVSGAEDFLVHIAVRDNQDLYAFVIDRLTERPEVADARTTVVYEHLHKTQITPNT